MSNFWHDLLFPLYFFVVFIAAHIALYIMIFKGDKSKWTKNKKLQKYGENGPETKNWDSFLLFELKKFISKSGLTFYIWGQFGPF